LSLDPPAIRVAYIEACHAELAALKPGNVHRHAPGHRMEVDDFVRSAEASAEFIAEPGARVGARVAGAVRATLEAAGQNTNLGIVLLCAPLAAAAEAEERDLRAALAQVLDRLDLRDAADVFAAIAAANPGGLGRADEHDVRAPASAPLLHAMAAAADRDRIACQYVSAYRDVFALGLGALDGARARGHNAEWSTSATYLAFLAEFPDTHVARKFDAATAERVRREAVVWRDRLATAGDPESVRADLMRWDEALKGLGVNPGTSADLTVATLFAAALRSARRSVLPSSFNGD
jgi:triphosphoribosyl-dephospho-CoA synthase